MKKQTNPNYIDKWWTLSREAKNKYIQDCIKRADEKIKAGIENGLGSACYSFDDIDSYDSGSNIDDDFLYGDD